MIKKIENILEITENYNIHFLLFSVLLLVLGTPFFDFDEKWVTFIVKGEFLLIVCSCYLIIRKNTILKWISYLTFLVILMDYFLVLQVLDHLSQIGISLLILFAFGRVLKEAMSFRSGASNMILISITGYVMIGLIGGFIAETIDQYIPNSYYHTTEMKLDLYNYIYYSFVTMTTLGYGDIVPIGDRAQSLAMALVLAGQLYLSIIIAMNISKFMQKNG